MYEYKAKVIRVVDGDTFIATVELGFHITSKSTFRLANIDTPETWKPKSEEERHHGELAKQFVIDAIDNSDIIIKTKKTGKYGRWIADVKYVRKSDDETCNLTEQLINHGFEKLKYVNGVYGG